MPKNVVKLEYEIIENLLDDGVIAKIGDALKNGDKVEIIPTKEGIKIHRVHRSQLNN